MDEFDVNNSRLASSTGTRSNKDPSIFQRLSLKYARFLSTHSRATASFVGLLIAATLIVSVCFSRVPDLNDPSREFITIGTLTAAKMNQFEALIHNTVPFPSVAQSGHLKRTSRSHLESLRFCFDNPDQRSSELWTRFDAMGKLAVSFGPNLTSVGSLLTSLSAVSELCTLQGRIERLPAYQRVCSRVNLVDVNSDCCPVWSLPNFIASITGKAACDEITRQDILHVRRLHEVCMATFLSGLLKRSCWDDKEPAATPSRWLCPGVPEDCFQHPNLLLLLATSTGPEVASNATPLATLFVLPVWRQTGIEFLRGASLDQSSVLAQLTRNLSVQMEIMALDLGVYDELSTQYLITDSVWLALGVGLLSSLLLLLTRGSFLVVLAVLTGLAWSLLVAYCLYSRVLGIATFPLINAMTIVLLLGLGADDILLFFQVWMSTAAPEEPPRPPTADASSLTADKPPQADMDDERRLDSCLQHAVPSVCLTSLATAGGLLASLTSSIVAVRRFAAFATISVVCHVIYVLLVMPSLVLLLRPSPRSKCCPHQSASSPGVSRWLARLVVRARFLFPCLLVTTVVVSPVLLFHLGWLHFPASGSLQTSFYEDNHPLEVYRRHGAQFSWAEAKLQQYRGMVTVNMVWSLAGDVTESQDTRNHWTWSPNDAPCYDGFQRGSTFNLTAAESIIWMRHFCDNLRQMPRLFVPPSSSINLHHQHTGHLEEGYLFAHQSEPWCPFGRGLFSFDNYAKAVDCKSSPASPCCGERDFARCLATYARESSTATGLRFFANSSEVVGVVVTAKAALSLHNTTFTELSSYANELDSWFSAEMRTAPGGLSNGFLVSPELAAFDTYTDVLRFLPLSLGLSISLAAGLVLISTLNLLLAFTAFLSVGAALLLCCLLLVLFDNWTLGVVEALILSLAAGLAVDPCLHLAFDISRPLPASPGTESGWLKRCRVSMETVGCAVTGAVLTTAIAGSAVLPSRLKCYHQMGVFLLLLMACSWIFCGISFVGCAACFPHRLTSSWPLRHRNIVAVAIRN